MNVQTTGNRGNYWFDLLTQNMKRPPTPAASIKVAEGLFHHEKVNFIAVINDKKNPYPRARKGEVGLLEGWGLGKVMQDIIDQDSGLAVKRPIIAIIDVPSQAYGRREEGLGIHQALAGAVAAYAKARLAGHPIIGLIVGKAMSGAFLAHGYQANRLIAFDDKEVMVHAMGKAAAARITLRTVEALEALAETIPPMAYDINHYATLGLLSRLLKISNPNNATEQDLSLVISVLREEIAQARQQGIGLSGRLNAENRNSSKRVRELMRKQWSSLK
jgi:malonate decarboxylase gamma subunit